MTINPTPSADFTWSAACEGKATKVTASSAIASQYTWDFGAAAAVNGTGAGPIEVTWASANTYSVSLTAKEGGCQAQTTHLITVNASPKVAIVAPSGSLCVGSEIPLEAYGASNYQWSPATDLSNPDIASPVARLQNNIEYTVTGFDGDGCSASASIALVLSSDCLAYNIPDAFTPNGDGKNDEFRVKSGDVPRSFSLIIFNRFGGKVFETSSISNGWNGNFGGNAAPTGTYVYIVQATTSTGTVVRKQGTVLLIR